MNDVDEMEEELFKEAEEESSKLFDKYIDELEKNIETEYWKNKNEV